MGMDSEFMKPVATDPCRRGGLLLQSINLEHSNSNYASAKVFNNIRLRIELEDERYQGDLLDYKTT